MALSVGFPIFLFSRKAAPSAIQAEALTFTQTGFERISLPMALSPGEVAGLSSQYERAAECAKWSCFNGAEVHSANSHMRDQFIRDFTNKRTDRYGGSV